jgi:hypothetical protein
VLFCEGVRATALVFFEGAGAPAFFFEVGIGGTPVCS